MRNPLNLLISYAFLRNNHRHMLDLVLTLADHCCVLIDSGAFTDFFTRRKFATSRAPNKKYVPITLDEYMCACRKWHGRVWQYIMLDSIWNAPQSQANLARMLDAGLRPMPVLVVTDPVERMAQLVEINEYVCVAGGVGSSDKYCQHRFMRAYEASGGRAKIHALGYLRWPDSFRLPIASGDSHALMNGQQFGTAMLFDPVLGLLYLQPLHSARRNARYNERLIGFLNECRVPAADMNRPELWRGHYSIPDLVTFFGYLRYMEFASRRGFRLFLAVSRDYHLTTFASLLATATRARGEWQSFDWPQARHAFDLFTTRKFA